MLASYLSIICVWFFTGLGITCNHVYPSEYAYERNSVSRMEHSDAKCRAYPEGTIIGSGLHRSDYVHCNGTQLLLNDSHFGSEMYNEADYYRWPTNSVSSQLLFIFPTRVHLTNITLHYYSDSDRGLSGLRFYAVPDDFDVWDAPTKMYPYIDIAPVQPAEVPGGSTNTSVHTNFTSKKVLLYKSRTPYMFTLSEVEFFTCSSKPA